MERKILNKLFCLFKTRLHAIMLLHVPTEFLTFNSLFCCFLINHVNSKNCSRNSTELADRCFRLVYEVNRKNLEGSICICTFLPVSANRGNLMRNSLYPFKPNQFQRTLAKYTEYCKCRFTVVLCNLVCQSFLLTVKHSFMKDYIVKVLCQKQEL